MKIAKLVSGGLYSQTVKTLTWMMEHFKYENELMTIPGKIPFTPDYSPELQEAIELLEELKSDPK